LNPEASYHLNPFLYENGQKDFSFRGKVLHPQTSITDSHSVLAMVCLLHPESATELNLNKFSLHVSNIMYAIKILHNIAGNILTCDVILCGSKYFQQNAVQ